MHLLHVGSATMQLLASGRRHCEDRSISCRTSGGSTCASAVVRCAWRAVRDLERIFFATPRFMGYLQTLRRSDVFRWWRLRPAERAASRRNPEIDRWRHRHGAGLHGRDRALQ
jgi:hypothetical protein